MVDLDRPTYTPEEIAQLHAERPGCTHFRPGEWCYPPGVAEAKARKSAAAQRTIAETRAGIDNLVWLRRKALAALYQERGQ